MSDAWKRLLGVSILCHLVVFGVILVVSVLSFSIQTVLAEFQWQWIMARTWSEYLRLAAVAQGSATVLVFGWIVPMTSGGAGRTSFERFGGSIGLLLVLTLVFAIAFLAGYPAAASRVESLEFTTTMAKRLRESADEARENQNYNAAISDLNQYLVLVGESKVVEDDLIDLREQARVDEVRLGAETELAPIDLPRSAGATELVDRAVAAQRREDYSTAHYMAILAQAIDPDIREASLIAAQALEQLETLAPDEAEAEESLLFRRKQDAKAALTRGDYIEAYYRFNQLAAEHPRDVDIRRYLEAAEDRVESLAVFREEVESALAMPGDPDVAFVNRRTGDSVELVSIGKLVHAPGGVYGQRIELLETTLTGRPIRHVSGAYGELRDGYFVLNVIDRESTARNMTPTVHVGTPDAATEGLLEVVPSAQELSLLASVSRNPATANMTALSRTVTTLESYGLIPEPVELEFVMRFVAPFGFLVVSLVLMGFGWRFRSRYLHLPPIPTLLAIPVMPFIVLAFHLLLQFAQRVMLSTILLAVGPIAAIILAIVLQAVLLLFALSYVALGSRG